ncbi:MAG: hypothetical protein CME98_01395 [Hyphomonas sp.]|nr:hypothetical protein [Hyphomonas sp.]
MPISQQLISLFFIFFQNWYNWGLAARSEQLFTLSSGSRNKLGELGLRLRERTIVQNAPRQHGCTWLQLAISCVNEQLFVIPNSSRPDTANAEGMTRAQGEQLFRTRQAA